MFPMDSVVPACKPLETVYKDPGPESLCCGIAAWKLFLLLNKTLAHGAFILTEIVYPPDVSLLFIRIKSTPNRNTG